MDTTEAFFYHLVTSNLGYEIPEPPLFKLTSPICMERSSITSLMAMMASSLSDMMAFRRTINNHAHMGLSVSTSDDSCPPPKTYLLVRSEPAHRLRKFLNIDEVKAKLTNELGIVDLQVVTTSSQMPVNEQAKLFGEFGLMIAPHSSQLIFSIFSQPKVAIVETAVTYFNSDFASIAQTAGLFYRFAIGGSIPRSLLNSDITPEYCNKGFSTCRGEPSCYEQHTTCSKSQRGDVKELDFEVDLDALVSSTQQAIDHLNKACGGQWAGARPNRR
jgi:hypothetical protein